MSRLANLAIPISSKCELILVDNNSTDNTTELVSRLWSHLGSPYELRLLSEPLQGLGFAKRRGALASTGDIVVFCDDDNVLDVNYLDEASRVFDLDPRIGVVGGDSLPVSSDALPAWFYTFSNHFAVGSQGLSAGDVTIGRGYVWGAGMVCRGHALRSIYMSKIKHLTVGRSAETLASGEDSELCSWFALMGFSVYYSPTLNIEHRMDSSRLTSEYLRKLTLGNQLGVDEKSVSVVYTSLVLSLRFWYLIKIRSHNLLGISMMRIIFQIFSAIKHPLLYTAALRNYFSLRSLGHDFRSLRDGAE